MTNPENILVVEDERVQQKIIGAKIRQLGFPVHYAGNGLQAFQMLKEHQIDLILLDLMMPEMNGYEVLEAIKSEPTLRMIPVIILSSVEEMESVIRCIEAGATDYLIKPMNISLLSARIKASLAIKRLMEQEIDHYKKMESINRKLELMNNITRHDLANSIIKVKGYADLLEDDICSGEGIVYHKKMNQAIDETINALSFARIYHDIGKEEPFWQNIPELINKIIQEKDREIEIDHSISELWLFADMMLEKAILNLVENTIRHGEKATRIEITGYQQDRTYYLIYTDNGVGVKADQKEHIFLRGFGRNTGLGLFLIREILGLTSISIQENGIPGIGVRFEIAIPIDHVRFSDHTSRFSSSSIL